MKVTLDVQNTKQIDISIAAVQNAIDGCPPRPVDLAPLIGIKGLLEQIRQQTIYNKD